MLILITGLPGAGKTTFALALAKAFGAVHLNTDRVRDALGMRGKYDDPSKEKVYLHLLLLLEQQLRSGKHAIVDATLFKPIVRQPFIALAERLGAPLRWIEVRAPESLIEKRLQTKRPFSEADFQVYLRLKDLYEPLDCPHLVIQSNAKPLDELVQDAITYLESPLP